MEEITIDTVGEDILYEDSSDVLLLSDDSYIQLEMRYAYSHSTGELLGTTYDNGDNTTDVKPFDSVPDGKTQVFNGVWELVDADSIDRQIDRLDVSQVTSITPRQARLILLRYGLLDDVEQAVSVNREYSIYWEYSLEIDRHDALLLDMTSALGISSQVLDKMFYEASTL